MVLRKLSKYEVDRYFGAMKNSRDGTCCVVVRCVAASGLTATNLGNFGGSKIYAKLTEEVTSGG